MSDFDADAILNTPITKAEQEGKKPLAPEGSYPGCLITDITPFPPNEKFDGDDVTARLRFRFECPTKDIKLEKFMKFKASGNHARSTYMKCAKAIFPNGAEDKTPNDFVGQTVDIFITHEDMNGNVWEDYKFTPSN